jgi:hypothetical protein
LIERLSALYKAEIQALSAPEYLVAHANLSSIQRQVDVFEKYVGFIPPGSRVLDWGCHHAPDSCMLREVMRDSVSIHGCDFGRPGRFNHFHGFADLEYRQLNDPIRLPYEAQTFDAVISSGVLEHTAMDFESLKELHRITREGGHLIVTFLPNRLSYTEFLARRRGLTAHLRLYGRGEVAQMLLHHGFIPVASNHHQFLPAHRSQGLLGRFWALNTVLERAWPLKLFCANIMLVARRCSMV